MTDNESLIVHTSAGDLQGARENGVAAFRGVPYAAPPVGELRFATPQPLMHWQGVRNAIHDGPIAPQARSRLAHVMGDFERAQSEDCLTLNVWTRSADAGARPVLVWFHGGAFSSGAGSLPWYSGERFAANGDVVVVSVNYRLGALGFLYLSGLSAGNLGLQDQLAALRWVRDNIRNFGGDPGNVTVVGQSAGASSIAALMTMPSARGLFHRAILQSTPFGRLSRTSADAQGIGEKFLDLLGLKTSELGRLKKVPVAQLLDAQQALGRLEKKFADSAAPFGLVVDGTVIPGDIATALRGGSGMDLDVMIGTTREEMAAFFAVDNDVRSADDVAIVGVFEQVFGSEHRAHYDEYRRLRPSGTCAEMLGDLMSDRVYRTGTLQFATSRDDCGRPAYLFQFDWQSRAGFASCHCLEIPFVFNNLPVWAGAPMLKGADPIETAGLASAMHASWIAFARSGNPNHDGLPPWPVYRRADRMTMRFDKVTGPVGDLAGLSWRKPWHPYAPR